MTNKRGAPPRGLKVYCEVQIRRLVFEILRKPGKGYGSE